jgi:AmmeMemoRadiSam system protein B/AmmeMemoRadiSam system protein A
MEILRNWRSNWSPGKLSLVRTFILISSLSLVVFCSNEAEEGGEMHTEAFVREPAVAGAFYPADKNELAGEVDSLLKQIPKQPLDGRLVAIIVPHAGYPYSGLVAAHSFKQMENAGYRIVVLVGPSHRAYFEGVAVYPKGKWQTPLGSLDVDERFASQLITQDELIVANPAAHQPEHSLEVQIPFIQRIDSSIRMVPVMMGVQTEETCTRLGNALSKAIGDRTDVLMLASSDLYHGHSHDECLSTDSTTLSYIEDLDPEGLTAALSSKRAQACGGGPIAAVLHASRRLGAKECKLLSRTNSGEVTGTTTGYVVGYSAWAVLAPANEEESSENSSLSADEKSELLSIARQSIHRRLKKKAMPEFKPESPNLTQKRGAFVTLNKGGRLRGCIGYILPMKPLHQTVSEVAIEAALGDPRFPPLTEAELSGVTIEISALTPLERIYDEKKIEVGRHGLYIKEGLNSGLLLPQVATEYGWSREAFLEHTCQKAGLPKDAWKEGAEIYIFSAEIFSEEDE